MGASEASEETGRRGMHVYPAPTVCVAYVAQSLTTTCEEAAITSVQMRR